MKEFFKSIFGTIKEIAIELFWFWTLRPHKLEKPKPPVNISGGIIVKLSDDFSRVLPDDGK